MADPKEYVVFLEGEAVLDYPVPFDVLEKELAVICEHDDHDLSDVKLYETKIIPCRINRTVELIILQGGDL